MVPSWICLLVGEVIPTQVTHHWRSMGLVFHCLHYHSIEVVFHPVHMGSECVQDVAMRFGLLRCGFPNDLGRDMYGVLISISCLVNLCPDESGQFPQERVGFCLFQ